MNAMRQQQKLRLCKTVYPRLVLFSHFKLIIFVSHICLAESLLSYLQLQDRFERSRAAESAFTGSGGGGGESSRVPFFDMGSTASKVCRVFDSRKCCFVMNTVQNLYYFPKPVMQAFLYTVVSCNFVCLLYFLRARLYVCMFDYFTGEVSGTRRPWLCVRLDAAPRFRRGG